MGGFIVGFDNDQQDIFKQQFDFIQRSGVVTAMVGLAQRPAADQSLSPAQEEGRLETDSTGNNTEAVLNFKPKLNREFLQSGYRDLMKKLYEPKVYYQRIRTFLKHHRPSGPRLRLSPADFQAFLKSFWLLGIWHRGRELLAVLLEHPAAPAAPVPLRHRAGPLGYHFRRVAQGL